MEKSYPVPKNVTGQNIKAVLKRLDLTQAEFAAFIGVSRPTVERWEQSEKPINGAITSLVMLLGEHPELEKEFRIPPMNVPMRLKYMFQYRICTIIDVDEKNRNVQIWNYTRNPIYRAFGIKEHPTFQEYEEFLESRCFPRTRDKLKIELEQLNIPFYDPLLIIEKTEGRMAEDDFWLEIERKKI